jgi:galactose mutarotase-like enzyme
MKVYSTQPVVYVYTGNQLPEGKNDFPHQRHATISLETTSFPNAVNQIGSKGWPQKGGILSMGEVYKQKTIHKFTTINDAQE